VVGKGPLTKLSGVLAALHNLTTITLEVTAVGNFLEKRVIRVHSLVKIRVLIVMSAFLVSE